ncbi:MAG: hypothetical protein U0T75_04725 [Chitinophagales bacterium]
MNRFLTGLLIFSVVLILGLLFNFIGGLWGDDKAVYDVTSSSSEGVNFVKEYKVIYLPDKVVGTFWTDFYVSKAGRYGFDYVDDKEHDKFSYRDLDDLYVKQYGLFPKFSWWQAHGCWVVLTVGFVLSIFGEGFWSMIFSIMDEVT